MATVRLLTLSDPGQLARSVARIWLPIAAGLTILAGATYAAVQQDLRQTANDPQIQLAEDAAAALAGGAQPESLLPPQRVDIAASLAPYVIVYDASGRVLASSGFLDGQPPSLPAGVLQDTAKRGEDRFTWQPRPGVRGAAVVRAVNGGPQATYVLAARSLREVEDRESRAQLLLALGWLGALGASLLATAAAVALL